ncbi:uncharacterized protein LOC141607488 [Silene latifolia]|uniref:uncharacterized protein LOC141607488 n=1 Tax=Silene latifolia TaxID=37657 RepID=UPI003D76A821
MTDPLDRKIGKVCAVKDSFKEALADGLWQSSHDAYTIAKGYQWLCRSNEQKVSWRIMVWNRYNYPKHMFIAWLIQKGRLLTLDRLAKMGICLAGACFLCGVSPETHQHLFSECGYTKKCFAILKSWLEIDNNGLGTGELILRNRRLPLLIRLLKCAVVMALYYHIWMARNTCRLECYIPRPEQMIDGIREDLKLRLSMVFEGQMQQQIVDWCRMKRLV